MSEKIKFAKLFDVDGEQVLFYLEPDHDSDGCDKLHQIVRVDGMYIDMALGGISYENADKAFAKVDAEFARQTLNTARDLLSGVA